MTSERRVLASLTLIAVACANASPARADVPASPALAAFDEGRRLEAAGDYAAAIGRFQESEQLAPSVGTELNLASCFEHEGRLASAARMYATGADRADAAHEAKRAQGARSRASALEKRASSIVILVADASSEGFALFVDDEPVDPKTWGAPRLVDGGVHHVRATARDRVAWVKDVTVAPEGDHARVEIPSLAPVVPELPSAPVASTAPPPVPPSSASAAVDPLTAPAVAAHPAGEAAAPASSFWTAPHVAGFVALGVGVAGVGIGAYSGVQAISLWNQRQSACPKDACSSAGATLGDDARSSATAATVALIAGAVGLGAGITLLVLPSHSSPPSVVRVGAAPIPGGTVLGASGVF